MSTTLDPPGEEEHEGTIRDLVEDKDEGEDASVTLESPDEESIRESAEREGETPKLAPSSPPFPSSPSPLWLLPEPKSTMGESIASPLHGAGPLGLPASQPLLSTDLLRRPAPATLPLTQRSSSHIPLLPGPAPVTLSSAMIGPDVALPSPELIDPLPATSKPTTLASEDPLLPTEALEPASAMPTPTREAPALPLPTLELAPTMPEPPFRPATPPAEPPEFAAITSASAAIASALGAIVSAHVSPPSPSVPARTTSAPAPRTSPPTTPRPAPASAPTRRRPVQRRSVRVRRRSAWRRRSWPGTWIKVVLLAIELPLTLMLATYAGVIPLLPPTPPAAQVAVAGAGTVVQARQSLYCWFTPGQARCSAPSASPAQALPELSIHQDGVLQFSFSYPAPTTCIASIPDNASTLGATKPLGTLVAQNDGVVLAPRTYRLRVTLAPGTYSVDVSCRWHPPQVLRWLQGQGESSYWLALRVLAG